MVQVRDAYPRRSDGSLDSDAWLASLPGFAQVAMADRMRRACDLAGEAQAQSDAPLPASVGCLDAGLEMVAILAALHLDEEGLIAALVYRAVRERRLPLPRVEVELGREVASLVQGVLRMAAISSLQKDSVPVFGQSNAQVENIRKMLVAMVDDVRIGLIKLAERTQAIRAVKDHHSAEKQRRVAREVFDIYAPLAHRLGIGQIKWELEDISFRYLQPQAYGSIAALIDEKRMDRQRYIDDVVDRVKGELQRAGIDASVSGRAKHIYSIWRKMQRKNIAFDQLYDIRALRILVPEVDDCYACLGIVHATWRNIPHEFDDYIAHAKDNGYRSLHTAVVAPEGRVLEIQIRTQEMHQEAELGVCAHWLYKGSDRRAAGQSYERKIAWLRQVLDWHEETGGDASLNEIAGGLADDFTQDRLYLFTPDGHVVDVASGSTPVDFAYHIHTEVGHRCRGARVDGRIVPLNTLLKNGQKVEIITAAESAPNRDWLRASLGYVNSSRARSKVRAWFKAQAREENCQAGRRLLGRELKRLALHDVDDVRLAKHLHYRRADDLYIALGAGDISTGQILRAAEALFGAMVEPKIATHRPSHSSAVGGNAITVVGVGNLMTQIAKCCQPVPGDEIVGYVTARRGVTVHRKDCRHFLQVDAQQLERVIEVAWGEKKQAFYTVDIAIEAYDRTGLLSDISSLLAAMRVNVIEVNTRSDKDQNTAHMRLTIEIQAIDDLLRILARLNNLPNIMNAKRSN